MIQDADVKLNLRLLWQKQHSTGRLFTNKFRDEIRLKCYIWRKFCMVLNFDNSEIRSDVPGNV
jgi:hypothetical protein